MMHRPSILKALCKRFPSWALSGFILVAGSLGFAAWWLSFQFRSGSAFPGLPSAISRGAGPSVDANEIRVDELVLCGNCLVSFRGKVLTREWLQGIGSAAPQIVKILPAERLVICGSRGFARAFGFDGLAKPEISIDGKAIGAAGYSFGDSRVLFIREGNIWLGHVDWLQSTVNDAKRITDAGYVREDSLRGDWFWHGDVVFIPILGRTHCVDLLTGGVSQDAANVGAMSRGVSPDGNRTAVAFGRGKFAVVNFLSGEAKQFPTRGHPRNFLWLDASRLAYGSSQNELSVLNADTGKVTAYSAPAAIVKLATASPKGESAIVGTSEGPMVFSTTSGKFTSVDLPMEEGAWISETEFLCSTSSTDTAVRGMWRVDANGNKDQITNQPVDSVRAAGGGSPMEAFPGGAVWVSGGDLWRYDRDSGQVSQLTHNANLLPSLQILSDF